MIADAALVKVIALLAACLNTGSCLQADVDKLLALLVYIMAVKGGE